MTVPPPSSLPHARTTEKTYRTAKSLPIPLLDSCTIWLEEQLFSQAFSLLTTTLNSGTGTATSLDAFVAPPQHLALAATLIVHPSLTTRTTSPDKHAGANDALRYLQHANSLLGAQNSGLIKALHFSVDAAGGGGGGGRSKRARARAADINSDDDQDATPGHLTSLYAGKESLWSNADDFWSVVGWAFNCSVVHPLRWARWQLWLTLMLDILQDDLEARSPEAEKLYAATQSTDAVAALLEDCLLVKYLSSVGEGRSGKRRVMRAVLADGEAKCLAEFGEVWRGETRGPRVKGGSGEGEGDGRAVKRRKLDLENGDFGDYYDEEEGSESRASSMRRSRSATAQASARGSRAASRAVSGAEENSDSDNEDDLINATISSPPSPLGAPASLHLRRRFLALILQLSTTSPDTFLDPEDLFDLYTEFLRPLPLPLFRTFVLPSAPWLGPNSQCSLNQMLLRPLLSTAAPSYNENQLTQKEFERFYAPFAANNGGCVDNAKVGLLVEGLLRLLWGVGGLTATKGLREKVEVGINARRERAGFDGRKRVGEKVRVEEEAWNSLAWSAERMQRILEMVEMKTL